MSEYSKELVSPDGEKYVAKSAREANDLIYGSGYTEVAEAGEEGDAEPPDASATGESSTQDSLYGYGGESR